jgi:tRNA threonylcarbamoyladenosine biosynthesis protein TsaB
MPSLSQLLASHRCLLVLDAASANVQIGLLRGSAAAIWRNVRAEAGATTFAGTTQILRQADLPFDAIDAFAYCSGPGSMLGIRTVAMALRTWQTLQSRPAYAYQSLAVAGRFEWTRNRGRSFTVIADARRETWHCQPVGADGSLPPLERRANADLPPGELLTPENFRAWAEPARPVGRCGYDLAAILPGTSDADLFMAVAEPDTFQSEAPDYKRWSAKLHSVETADKK